jgi:uncharacterized protein YjbJ (UPF0337 family)
MDKDRVKGAVNDAAGRVKRQVGEWTGDTNAQVEGTAQQMKGKAQKAWGNVKDAARDAHANVHRDNQSDVERARGQEREREAEARRKEELEHAHHNH